MTQPRHDAALAPRAVARRETALMGVRIATGREIGVGGVLIRVRAALIALAGRLIVLRPCRTFVTRAPAVPRGRRRHILMPGERIAPLCAAVTTLGGSVAGLRGPVAIARGLIATPVNRSGRDLRAT
jgi:hypothetical protein